MEDMLKDLVETFNKRIEEDEKLKEAVKDKTRSVVMEVTDGDCFSFRLEDCKLNGPNKGDIEDADVRVISDLETYTGIFSKEINPMKAYATKKLRLKASLTDLMLLQKLLK